MFETFVFGTQAQTANACTVDDDRAASPTDCSFLSTASSPPSSYSPYKPRGGLNDIVHQMSQQSLHPEDNEEPQQSIWNENSLPSPDFDQAMLEFTAEELSYTSTLHGGTVTLPHHATQSLPTLPSLHPPRGTVACRRLQRQLNVQLQSCASHMKDLSTLVEEMVATQSQCRVVKPTPSRPQQLASSAEKEYPFNAPESEAHFITPDEDEGFVEMNEDDFLALDETVTLRRASTPSGIRKYNLVRWRKSADCVNAINSQGKMKVRNVPRMRRRPQAREMACTTAS